jgi:hypothetical protein
MSRQQAMNDSAAPSPSSAGHLTRCLAWAEASGRLHAVRPVFCVPDHQRVIKLFAPPNDGGFGYVLDQSSNGGWRIRGGSLIEALNRVAWFKVCFVSGLELDSLGTRADFLTLNQPFFVGRRPCDDGLEEWMKACGWAPWSPAAESAVVAPTKLVAR